MSPIKKGGEFIQRHVAVCAFPFGTHAAPLLLLIQKIAEEAPNIRFTFFNTEKSNAIIFKHDEEEADNTHPSNNNIQPYVVHDGIPHGHVFSGNHAEPIGLFLKSAPANIRRSMAEAEDEVGVKIDCIIADAFLWFCQGVAEEKDASWIPLWTAGPNSLSAHLNTDVLRAHFGVEGTQGSGEEKLDWIPGFSSVPVKDIPEGIVAGNLQSPISLLLHRMATHLPKATALVINSFEELAPEITSSLRQKLNKSYYLSVGPFSLFKSSLSTVASSSSKVIDPHKCMEWLDKQQPESVAYISFGTVTAPPPQEIIALAEALQASEVPFLWSMKDNFKVHLSESFLERTSNQGKIVPWAPQSSLLSHSSIGVFITHCGWNSFLESVSAGVPMICRPFFGDQKLNMRFIETIWKIGVGIEGGVFKKGVTFNALQKVLLKEEGKHIRKNVKLIKEKGEEAVKLNGSSSMNFKTLVDIVTMPKH